MDGNKLTRWLCLLGTLCLVFALVFVAQRYSKDLPGTAGAMYRQNIEQDIEATALIYTESGHVIEYLDHEHGKYGLEIDMAGHLQ